MIIKGNPRNNSLNGTINDDVIIGFKGNDYLIGHEGNDILRGKEGDDYLEGGAGNDTLNGQIGTDSLYGGAGDDVLRVTDFDTNDVLHGGTGIDSLQIRGSNQTVDLRNAHYIKDIELIRLKTDSRLIVSEKTVVDLSSDSNTLIVQAHDSSNTLSMEQGWIDQGMVNDYHQFSKGDALLKVSPVITDIQVMLIDLYTISSTNTAQQVSSLFNSGVQEITLDFAGKKYRDVSIDTIDLTGFGLEDKLIISLNDGAVYDYETGSYNTTVNARTHFIQQDSSYAVNYDRVSWQKGAESAKLISSVYNTYIVWNTIHDTFTSKYSSVYTSNGVKYTRFYTRTFKFSTTFPTYVTDKTTGHINIVGLPQGLADSQFIFI